MQNPKATAQIFLESFQKQHSLKLLEKLQVLLTELEERDDPDGIEINLVHDIYQFVEKFHLLEKDLKLYLKDYGRRKSVGDLISELYEKSGKIKEY